MREVAGHDWDKAQRVKRWPLREALLAALAMRKEQARLDYRDDLRNYLAIAPWATKDSGIKPPQLPEILRS